MTVPKRRWPKGGKWVASDYRGEYTCPHGVGHGNHIHGCDGCCARKDYPLKGEVASKESTWETKKGLRIDITDLDDSHLANIILMLACSGGYKSIPGAWGRLTQEAVSRGLYPYGLEGGKRRKGY